MRSSQDKAAQEKVEIYIRSVFFRKRATPYKIKKGIKNKTKNPGRSSMPIGPIRWWYLTIRRT
jgi:hypothetical protein